MLNSNVWDTPWLANYHWVSRCMPGPNVDLSADSLARLATAWFRTAISPADPGADIEGLEIHVSDRVVTLTVPASPRALVHPN
jgi:hypothetical protein